MRYPNITEAVFLKRPNRFIAIVRIGDREETAHVKNTGRCRELLVEGARVWLVRSDNPERRTAYDLVAVEKQTRHGAILINMDSAMPNDAAFEWLSSGGLVPEPDSVRREVTCGASRFDFLVEKDGRRTYVEVKGCTLEQDGVARFPDAPTERGVKHIEELTRLAEEGIGAVILFVVQMRPIRAFTPNYATHRAFGEALVRARDAGVQILAVDSVVEADSLVVGNFIPVELSEEIE